MAKKLELTNEEIIADIKIVYGIEVYPKDITAIFGFGRPTYVINHGGQYTFLCRKTNLGIVQTRQVKWY